MKRYIIVHGDFAWLKAVLVADRYYADGNMTLFQKWIMVGKRLDTLLPQAGSAD